MGKVILTKKRLKALDTALSIDDILYAKFDKMYQEFHRHVRAYDRKKQVVCVIGKKNDANYVLQIIKEIKTNEGIYLEVKLDQ